MATEIAKAYVQIVPSARGMQQQLSSVFDNEMPSAGSKAGGTFGSSMVGKIKGIIAATGVGKMLSDALQSGANMQQSLGGIETLFKDSADTVIKNAEQAYKTAGMSANEYMETVMSFSASLLQGLSGDTEKAASVADMALTDMSDNANKMGTSMELIQNAYQGFAKQNYTMLDNLKLGYGGTKTEMERLLADAQKLTGVEYDISNLSDVYSAIHAIQEEMDITGTTAKESASTFSGSLASMKSAFSNVLANLTLGRDIGPSLRALGETVFTFVKDNLLPMVGNLLSGLPAVFDSAIGIAIGGLNMVSKNADVIVENGVALVTEIGKSIISAVPYLAEAGLSIVSALGDSLINMDWEQIGSDTITAIKDSLNLASGEIFGSDDSIVQAVLESIRINLPAVLECGVEMIVELATGILQGLPNVLASAGEILDQLLIFLLEDALPALFESGADLAEDLADGLYSNLPEILRSAADLIAQLLASLASRLPELLAQGYEMVGELAAGLISAIPEVIASVPQIIDSICSEFDDYDWADIGWDIICGIANGITSGVSQIADAAWSAAKSALGSAKRALGIASPSKVMRDEIGKQIPAGIAVGIEANTNPLTEAMHDISDMTVSAIDADLRFNSARVVPAPQAKSTGNFSFTFNVYGAEGQNVDELADILMQKMQFEIAKVEAKLA